MAVWRRSGLGRDYRRLWAANAVSVTGDGVTVTAGPLLAASITHDPLLVAGALFAQQLPWLIFTLFSGALVDRLQPARLMVIVDLLRAAAIGGLAASVLAGAAHLAALYGALFILGAGSTVSDTAVLSLPPLLVGPKTWSAPIRACRQSSSSVPTWWGRHSAPTCSCSLPGCRSRSMRPRSLPAPR